MTNDVLDSSLAAAMSRYSTPINKDSLVDLEKELKMRALVDGDKPIEDASLQMLTLAQGPSKFSYLFPEATTANRIVNTVAEKDITRLVGTPRTSDVKGFLADKEARDKVLWTLTGNAVKADGYSNRVNSK